ncbi:MAG: hypothetical protein KGJ13_06300 [Patescibacteria group bacterium]|nr:hypothetical protein [Patescibacteria group bacterium]
MHKVFEWLKSHPLAIVLIGGALILMYLLFSGGSSSSTATTATTVDPNAAQEIAANAAITQANIAASAQEYQVGAQLQATNNQTAAQLAATQIGANLSQYQTQQQTLVQQQNIAAGEDVSLAGIQSQVQLADIAAQTNQAQIQATTDQAQITANAYEALAAGQVQTAVAGYQTQADIAATNADANVKMAQYQSLSNIIASAASGKKTSVTLTPGGGLTYTNAKGPATASSQAGWGSSIGGILGGIGSLFG